MVGASLSSSKSICITLSWKLVSTSLTTNILGVYVTGVDALKDKAL